MIQRLLPALFAMLLLGCDGTSSTGENKASTRADGSETSVRLPGSGETQSGQRPESLGPSDETTGAAPARAPTRATADVARDTAKRASTEAGPDEAKNFNQLNQDALYAREASVRIEALQALAEQPDMEVVVPVFETALQDQDKEVRETILRLIHRKKMPVASELIHDIAVNDPDDMVRGVAWVNLSDRGDPELREYLIEALNDPNPDIRRDAQNRLDRIESKNR